MKTFVIRVFVPAEPEPGGAGSGLHGLVEEIGSGRQASFQDARELLSFLDGRRGELEPEPTEGSLS